MSSPELSFAAWLEPLRILVPVTGLVHVGAGGGQGVVPYAAWEVPAGLLVEADEATHDALARQLGAKPGWHTRHALAAADAGDAEFHVASNPLESGLLPAEALVSLWRNLKSSAQGVPATTLDHLLADAGIALTPNWLVIGCLPAQAILKGMSRRLDKVDVIIARVVAQAGSFAGSGAGLAEARHWLEARGFRYLAYGPERQPAIGHALFVRDGAQVIRQHQAAQAAAEKQAGERQQRVEQLQKAGDEQVRLAADRQAQIDKLTIDRDQQAKTAAERAEQLAQANQAREEQVRLAADRQAQIDKLTIDRDQQAKTAAERAEQLAQANQAREEQARLAADRQAQIEQLTKVYEKINGLTPESLVAVESRLRNDLNKGLANSVRQIEDFMRIQSFLGPGDYLGDFHGWPISPDIGLFLLERIRQHHYDLIIELGSGTSTALLARAVEVLAQRGLAEVLSAPEVTAAPVPQTTIFTFEHDTLYHGKTLQMLKARGLDRYVRLLHAPLVDWCDGDQTYLYYDCQSTLAELAQQYAHRELRILLLVDGPPGATCLNARYPAVPFVFTALGRHQIDVVLDDASRPEEKQVIELWRAFWKQRAFHLDESQIPSEKGIYFATSQS